MTRARIDRLARIASSARANAIDAVSRGSVTWRGLYEIIGPTRLACIEELLIEEARVARSRRDQEEAAVSGDPYSLGAQILSYPPGELPPTVLASLLDLHFARLAGHRRDADPFFDYGLAAAEVKLILLTRDGLGLREWIWTDPGSELEDDNDVQVDRFIAAAIEMLRTSHKWTEPATRTEWLIRASTRDYSD